MVTAWASANHVSLGQVAVDEKSNEITAIPRLLELLDLSGALVTIDALGCQKEIAAKIVTRGGDYLLAVKDNQPNLHQDIKDCFDSRWRPTSRVWSSAWLRRRRPTGAVRNCGNAT